MVLVGILRHLVASADLVPAMYAGKLDNTLLGAGYTIRIPELREPMAKDFKDAAVVVEGVVVVADMDNSTILIKIMAC